MLSSQMRLAMRPSSMPTSLQRTEDRRLRGDDMEPETSTAMTVVPGIPGRLSTAVFAADSRAESTRLPFAPQSSR